SLTVLMEMLAGNEVAFNGRHLRVNSPPSLPLPVQPRIPIWVGGFWPNRAPFVRAAQYDGVVPNKQGPLTPDDLVAIRELVGRTDAYDYVASGNTSSPSDTEALKEWEAAGATWWLESMYPFGGRADAMRERLRAGPPRL